jgi:hypothetical protein
VDLEEEIAKGAEAVNAAEEWLLKARRVRRLIEQRVREAVSLDGTPAVRAPGVEPEPATGLYGQQRGHLPRPTSISGDWTARLMDEEGRLDKGS